MIRELDKDEMKKLEQGELELISGGVIIEAPPYPGSGVYFVMEDKHGEMTGYVGRLEACQKYCREHGISPEVLSLEEFQRRYR